MEYSEGEKIMTSIWRLGQKSGVSNSTMKLGRHRSSWISLLCSLTVVLIYLLPHFPLSKQQ